MIVWFKFLLFFIAFTFKLFSVDCMSTIPSFDKPIDLQGKWFFKKGDNVDWKNKDHNDSSGWNIVNLPDFKSDKETKVVGFYWYRCSLQIAPELKKTMPPIAIRLGKLREADEVYLNGNLIGFTGKLTPFVSDYEAVRIYSLPLDLLEAGKNVIAIRLYSSTDQYGFLSAPQISTEPDVYWKIIKTDSIKITFGFVFILMGVFFIIASIVKSTNKSNLFFSLFSIFLGFYTLYRSHYRYILNEDFSASMRNELLCLIPLPALFVNFLIFYNNFKRNVIVLIYEGIISILFILSIFSKNSLHWKWIILLNAITLLFPIVFGGYVIFTGYKKDKKKIKYVIIGTIALVPCAIVDALTAVNIISLPEFLPFGFMFFLVNISLQLSEEVVENYKNYLNLEKALVKMERLKNNFLFNISDEFRYYTDSVLKYIKDFKAKPVKVIQKEDFKILYNLSDLSLSLIRDAVILDQIEQSKYEVVNERFSIKEIILDAIHKIETRIGKHRENVSIIIENEDINIIQSKELVSHIFYHLLENAYNYSPIDSTVQVFVKTKEDKLEFAVQDQGPGLSEEDKEKIFKKFLRVDTIKPNSEVLGAGIGLNLVDASTNLLNGTLTFESEKEKGSTFTVLLPYLK